MNKRFYIEKLVITGIGVEEASLKFINGVNLIVGSSDTGKSYIFQCIDYLLGSETCPKNIPESDGYSEAYLQIKTNENKTFTIFRNLKTPSNPSVSESTYNHYKTSQKIVLGQKNSTLKGENISEFLLELMGVKDVLLKINANNKTRKISFRDIARLTLIDESRIITEGSPIYTSMNNYYDFTVEKSAFKFLLTESIDNELVEKEDKKIFESRIKGKLELITSLLLSKNKIIEDIQNSQSGLTSDEINKRVFQLLEKLESSTKRIEELTSKRELIFNNLQLHKSTNLHNNELLKRFYLLQEHYKNDLSRLNFILEGDFLFEQLITKDCPICGTKMDEEHLKCLARNQESKAIGESVKIEGQKIELKLLDLTDTIQSLEKDNQANEIEIAKIDKDLESINVELNSELLPIQQNFQSQIEQLITYNKSEQDVLNAKTDITNLHFEKDNLERELKSKIKPEEAYVNLEYTVLKAFAEHVEIILKSWNFPKLTTVEFDSSHKIFDLSISGRGRNSHGKGVRAISYTAFTFALLDYCIMNSKSHPGFIVLDSPLTTYHNNQKREKDDEINNNMQESFFNELINIKDDRQVIILDNKIPSDEVISKINYVQFKENSLRSGFFPN